MCVLACLKLSFHKTKNDPATIFLSSRSMEKLVACCPYFSMKKKKITTTKKERKYENGSRNRSYRIKKKEEKKGPLYIINLKSFSLTLLKKETTLDISSGLY